MIKSNKKETSIPDIPFGNGLVQLIRLKDSTRPICVIKPSLSNFRYDCVRAQYLSGPDTNYNDHDYYRWSTYWMVTKCHPNYTDMPIIELCTNPGLHGSVESVVPVTLMSINEHFRNKYCALCNKHDLNDIFLDWKLDIYADSFIRFPDQNFLDRIKSNRENIFFTPPSFVKYVARCAMPSYTIRKCNESGLYGQYNDDIELACNSFTDPYNQTYKNVFCYMCNRGLNFTEISYKFAPCGKPSVIEGRKRPEFIAEVSIDTVMGYNSEEQPSCGTQQFQDRKLVRKQSQNLI